MVDRIYLMTDTNKVCVEYSVSTDKSNTVSAGLSSFWALGAEDLRAPWHCSIEGGALGSGCPAGRRPKHPMDKPALNTV
ncbi:hypothetical protein TNCV_279991 [Trichonephila clavipes]|nr:hypothetical protein TNCV_279991 [Trichonephila clavipes]